MELEQKIKEKILNFIYTADVDKLRGFSEKIFDISWQQENLKEDIIDALEVGFGEIEAEEQKTKPKPKKRKPRKPKAVAEKKKPAPKKQKPSVPKPPKQMAEASPEQIAKMISDDLKDVPDEIIEGEDVYSDAVPLPQKNAPDDDEEEMM